MSEKRFHIERDSTSTFTFFYDGKHRLYDEEVVNLLNEQTVEIQKLTKERDNYKGQIKQKNDKIERLQGENNKLQVHYKYDVKHLKEENRELRQKIKHWVYVDVDNEKGCMNCKYDIGSICSILDCGTHDYLIGVSECGLKYWESLI